MSKHNWPAIQRDYVEGWQTQEGLHLPTMEELAAKHGVYLSYLRTRAASAGWTDRRQEFLEKIEQERNKVQARALAAPAAKFNEKIFAVADKAVDLIAERIIEVTTPGEDGKKKSVPFYELSRLTLAIKHVQAIGAALLRGEEIDELDITPGGVARGRGRTVFVTVTDKPPPEKHTDDDV